VPRSVFLTLLLLDGRALQLGYTINAREEVEILVGPEMWRRYL
jgi:hypothetical protein